MKSTLSILLLLTISSLSVAFLQQQGDQTKQLSAPITKIGLTKNNFASSPAKHNRISSLASPTFVVPQLRLFHSHGKQQLKIRSFAMSYKLLRTSQLSSSSSESDGSGTVEPVKAPIAFFVGLFGAVAHLFLRFWAPQYKAFSRFTLAAFMFGGAGMRLDSDMRDKLLFHMVPPPLPKKLTVYASGLAEAICGVLLLVPSMKELGSLLTVALLWAVYPSNIYAAVSSKFQKATGMENERALLFVRLPIQLLFIYWASWFVETKAMIPGPLSWFVW